jgi:hypothetical protein
MRATLQAPRAPVLARLRIGLPWTGSARAPARDAFSRDVRRGRRLLRGLDALLLVVALSVTYAVVRLRNPPQAATSGNEITSTAPAARLTRAEHWMAANLATGARVGADSVFARLLADTGRPDVDVLSAGSTGWPADRYIVLTPKLRNDAQGDPALSAALASSRPIAMFGTGTVRVEVRQVAADGPTALERRWQQDITDRAVAGAGLLHNPRVHEGKAAQQVLAHGGLDLRAVVLVGLLAANVDVRILGITADPSEAAAGMPARRVQVSIAGHASSITATVATMPRVYRPSSITPLSDRERRLTWPVEVAPVPSLS